MKQSPKHRSNTAARTSFRDVLVALANPTTATSAGRRTAHLQPAK